MRYRGMRAGRQLVASESQRLSYNSTALILWYVRENPYRTTSSQRAKRALVLLLPGQHLLCLLIRRCRTVIKCG